MYFYIYKNIHNENEQAQLLEVCGNARFSIRNGKSINGINSQPYSDSESCGAFPATFLFYPSCIIS